MYSPQKQRRRRRPGAPWPSEMGHLTIRALLDRSTKFAGSSTTRPHRPKGTIGWQYGLIAGALIMGICEMLKVNTNGVSGDVLRHQM
ncbi:hypothetical protein JMJ77_0013703 [Colletotrichum scovillei]|uniref:Uncharacterized protein n=1 Tax=Colletotrichum scovillei TaxID=1209932 RepID=A0A9P7UB25_9PEZI|nr:hypothetical protein JMJ77_0013703 [Colletotrichum scovillei]KAG7065218.1 hypothetical protein JMJ78_0011977 [Colletotrichum scovillei]KAG7067820.1 hypothetical protein JMJ76_0007522 [Colletotrichum scovillei]